MLVNIHFERIEEHFISEMARTFTMAKSLFIYSPALRYWNDVLPS